jgi:hypothetical protein
MIVFAREEKRREEIRRSIVLNPLSERNLLQKCRT